MSNRYQRFQHNQNSLQPSWNKTPQLPLDYDAILYPRVSTPQQRGNVSEEMQKEEDGKLWTLGLRCGWKRHQIHVLDDDLAISATLKMEERPAFRKMLNLIITGQVRAVLAIDPDRVFRDKWGQEYGKFMEICERYQTLVVTPSHIYDFSNPNDIKLFRDACERAWDYMEYQVYGKLLGAREFLGQTGRYRGHFVPIGFRVDRNEKSPIYRKYVPVPEHIPVAIRIYERYREMGNNLNRLFIELASKPFVFPDVENPEHWILPKAPGGYTFKSIKGLTGFLTNVVNVGYWVYDNMLLCDELGNPLVNHEPLIPPELQEELFWYVFNQRSHHLLDGTPNPNVRRYDRYTQRGHPEPNILLKDIIKPALPHWYINFQPKHVGDAYKGEHWYALYYKDGPRKEHKYMISTQDLDDIFWRILAENLEHCTDFDEYGKDEEQTRTERERELREIDAQIAACASAMEKLQKKLKVVDDPDLISDINEDFKKWKMERIRQVERRKTLVDPANLYAEKMVTYRELVQEFKERRHELATIEELRLVVDTFTTAITIEALSPRIYKVDITWRDTRWGEETLLCLRDRPAQPQWTDKEDWQLRLRYPTNPFRTLVKYFPNRSIQAIFTRANELRIARRVQDRNKPFDIHLCLQDYQLLQQYPPLGEVKFVRLCSR